MEAFNCHGHPWGLYFTLDAQRRTPRLRERLKGVPQITRAHSGGHETVAGASAPATAQ